MNPLNRLPVTSVVDSPTSHRSGGESVLEELEDLGCMFILRTIDPVVEEVVHAVRTKVRIYNRRTREQDNF